MFIVYIWQDLTNLKKQMDGFKGGPLDDVVSKQDQGYTGLVWSGSV